MMTNGTFLATTTLHSTPSLQYTGTKESITVTSHNAIANEHAQQNLSARIHLCWNMMVRSSTTSSFRLELNSSFEPKGCGGEKYDAKGCNVKKYDSHTKASAPSTTHATVRFGQYAQYEKPDSGAVTPPVNMFKTLVVMERIYSPCANFPGTTISTGAGLMRN